jgi:hypothetical protein
MMTGKYAQAMMGDVHGNGATGAGMARLLMKHTGDRYVSVLHSTFIGQAYKQLSQGDGIVPNLQFLTIPHTAMWLRWYGKSPHPLSPHTLLKENPFARPRGLLNASAFKIFAVAEIRGMLQASYISHPKYRD